MEDKTLLDGVSREELVEVARKLKPLQKKFDTLIEKFKEVSKESTLRKKECELLQDQRKQAETQLLQQKQEFETRLTAHESQVLALQTQLQTEQTEYENQVATLQSQARERLVEHEAQIAALQSQGADNKSEAMIATENDFQLLVMELKAKNATLLDAVRDAHDNKTLAQDREQEAKRNLDKVKKEMKTLDERLKQTQANSQQEKAELETQIVDLQKQLEGEIASFETQKSSLNLALNQSEQARLTALDLIEQLKATCVEKDNKYAASGQELAEVRGKLAQVEKRQAKVLGMEQEVIELRTKYEAVQASLEQERLDRAKERTRHQQDLELEREERVRERASQEQAREKMAHLRYEETEKAHTRWQEAHTRALKAEETLAQLTSTVNELNQIIEKKSKELEEALGEGGAAKQREAELSQEHKEAMQAAESKHNDKYQRLLREFKAYRERTTKILDEQATKLQQNASLITKLEEEIATGKPGERRMFELAELQARRDVHIQQQEAELAELREVVAAHEAKAARLEEDKKQIAEQCRQLQASRSRGEINIDYLKNVLLRFLCAAEGSTERKNLIPALGKILQFSPEETACLNQQGSGGSWWSVFAPAPTQKVSMWVGQDITPVTPASSSGLAPTPPPTPPRRGSNTMPDSSASNP